MCACPQRPEEHIRSPGAGVTAVGWGGEGEQAAELPLHSPYLFTLRQVSVAQAGLEVIVRLEEPPLPALSRQVE